MLPRPDGDVELDALFVEPEFGAVVLRDRWSTTVLKLQASKDLLRSGLLAIPTPSNFTKHLVSASSKRSRLVSALDCSCEKRVIVSHSASYGNPELHTKPGLSLCKVRMGL